MSNRKIRNDYNQKKNDDNYIQLNKHFYLGQELILIYLQLVVLLEDLVVQVIVQQQA